MINYLNKGPFSKVVQELIKFQAPESQQLVTGVDDSARAVLWAQLFNEQPSQLLIIP